MKWAKISGKEALHLWVSATTALAVGCLYLMLNSHHGFRQFLDIYPNLNVPELMTNGLFFWALALLWLSYHRYHLAFLERSNLECVVQSVNHDVLMVVNPDRRIVACNDAISNVFGYDADEVLDKTTDLLYFDRRAKKGEGHEIFHHIENYGYHVGLATGKKKNGETFPLQIFTGKLKERRGTVLLLCDITSHVEAEDELRQARDSAEDAKETIEKAHEEKSKLVSKLQDNYAQLAETEEARDSLTHMIVHDMKLPLQVIKGYMELVKRKMQRSDHEIKPIYIDETLDQTKKLVEMVHSLLDISRLESNEMPLDLNHYELGTLARHVIDSMGSLVQQSTIQLDLPPEPIHATCDRDVTVRILANLLNNALKYNPAVYDVTVTIRVDGAAARFEVTDHGPGVPPEYHEKIFEKFGQVKQQRRKTSTGLGLTFCKLAVEAQSGQIGVYNHDEGGCSFWFSLPLCEDASALRPDAEPGSVLSQVA